LTLALVAGLRRRRPRQRRERSRAAGGAPRQGCVLLCRATQRERGREGAGRGSGRGRVCSFIRPRRVLSRVLAAGSEYAAPQHRESDDSGVGEGPFTTMIVARGFGYARFSGSVCRVAKWLRELVRFASLSTRQEAAAGANSAWWRAEGHACPFASP
jgi:hypothetical protein